MKPLRCALFLLGWCALVFAASGAGAHESLLFRIGQVTDRIQDEPRSAELRLYRGELHRLAGDEVAAREDYDAAARLDPALTKVWLARAHLELDLARYEEALAALDTYAARHPGDPEASRLRDAIEAAAGRGVASFVEGTRARVSDPPDGVVPRVSSVVSRAGERDLRQSTTSLWIPRHSTWRFEDSGTDLGTAWREASYDDSAWSSGPGILGYGEAYVTTVVSYGPSATDKHRTTYFRTSFEVMGDPQTSARLLLAANFDDGFVAYVNGDEVLRQGLPLGPVPYDAFAASHEGGAYEIHDITAFKGSFVPGVNVLAVEVHQTSSSSSDLVWDVELVSSDDPVFLLRGPYLQAGTPDGVVIRWRTDVPTESVVRYSTVPGFPAYEVATPGLTTEHEVPLEGLFPATRYYYTVGTLDIVLAGGDTEHSFVTSPVAGSTRPVRIWAIGDSGLVGPNQDAVRDAYLAYDAATPTDVWLMLGDNAYNTGTDAEYQGAVFDAYASILRNTILWPTRGNHDGIHAGPDNDYYDIFTLPTQGQAGGVASNTEAYYSFDYGTVHFVCLDSQGSSRLLGSLMLDWLQQDLAANALPWVIAYWHHPPYTKGSHDSDTESQLIQMRENATTVLESAGVDLVLTGHSHSYERSKLIHGHYGVSSTLLPSHVIDGGDGRIEGDGAYLKSADEGAVYAVVGSSSRLGGGDLNHPVMITSLNELGSLVVDVEGQQLDGVFLDAYGVPRDDFTIIKSIPVSAPPTTSFDADLTAHPNPFSLNARLQFRTPRAGIARIDVYDLAGRHVATLLDGPRAAGSHWVTWDGRDDRGGQVATGTYLARLRLDDELVQTRKVALVR